MAIVREVWRYPVKSMAGERLDECAITDVGLEGDRRWAMIDHTPERDGKWFNIKQHAPLMTYKARLNGTGLEVTAPDGSSIGLEGAFNQLLADSRKSVELRELPGANFDASHILIVNLASVAAFGLQAGMAV